MLRLGRRMCLATSSDVTTQGCGRGRQPASESCSPFGTVRDIGAEPQIETLFVHGFQSRRVDTGRRRRTGASHGGGRASHPVSGFIGF